MSLNNYMIYTCNKIKSIFFKIIDIQIFDVTEKTNYYQYIFLQMIILFNNIIRVIPYFGSHIINILNKVNINKKKYNIVHFNIFKNNLIKKVIMENDYLENMINKAYNLQIDVNDYIMNKKHIITDINICGSKRKISVKNILDDYSDKNKNFDHSIKNILLFSNIDFYDDDVFEIKYIEFPKKKTKLYYLNDILKWHICDVYNLN